MLKQIMEQPPRRRKTNGTCSGRKSVVPVSFKLHTELLAEQRKQLREEKTVAQLLHTQHKILGKKTVEDFAQLKLMRRETATTRSRSLHCNGTQLKATKKAKGSGVVKASGRHVQSLDNVHLESRPLQSARDPIPRMVADSLPQRPQSAKPVLQSHFRSTAGCHGASGEEGEQLDTRQSKILQSKRRQKKKIANRRSGRLSPSKSAPVLPDRDQSPPTCKKINIIVNMRNLRLSEEQDSPSRASIPFISREAWALAD